MSAESGDSLSLLPGIAGLAGQLRGNNPAAQLTRALESSAEAVKIVAQSKVEIARIQADAKQEIAKIHALKEMLLSYLDKSFDERRENFARLFDNIDKAYADGRLDEMSVALNAMVSMAAQSPFKALADAATAAKVLKDKSIEWEL